MSEEKWDKQTVAKCVYYICVHSNSKELMDEVYKYQEQDRLSEIPTQIMSLTKQLQTAKEENEKLKETERAYNYMAKLANSRLDKIEQLTQQNKQMREAIENLYTIADNGQNMIKKHNDYNGKIYGLGYLQDIKDRIYNTQQALKGVE